MTAAAPGRLPPPLPSDAAEVAADILVMLRRGCVAVALAQLEKLPLLIRDELTDRVSAAYWRGRVMRKAL